MVRLDDHSGECYLGVKVKQAFFPRYMLLRRNLFSAAGMAKQASGVGIGLISLVVFLSITTSWVRGFLSVFIFVVFLLGYACVIGWWIHRFGEQPYPAEEKDPEDAEDSRAEPGGIPWLQIVDEEDPYE